MKIQRFSAKQFPHWLEPRHPTSHKGDYGRLVIIDGDCGTTGTIRMMGEAVLRAGAGSVRVLTRSEDIAPLPTARSELIMYELTMGSLTENLEWADVMMINLGLGQQEWGKKALQKVESFRKPMLWDADALNLPAINPDKYHNRVITPYPDEVARLLDRSVAEIGSDHLHYTKRLVQRYSGTAMLKDAEAVVAAHPDVLGIVDAGSAGMVNGGIDGMLSSVIDALLGQKLSPYDAAYAGCVTYGTVADVLTARSGTHGMLATDLFSALQRTVNPETIDKNYDEPGSSVP